MTQSSEKGLKNFIHSFSDLLRLPRAFWIVIAAFVIDTSAFFGKLSLMTIYLSTDLHWGDERAGVTVSVFTMLVTLFMLGARYVPENAAPTQIHSGTLWFFYGCIAMLSPIGLWLARKWVMKGMHTAKAA